MIKFSAAKSMQQKVGEKVGEKVGVEVDDKELTVLNHLCDDPGSSYVQIAKKNRIERKNYLCEDKVS